MKRKLLFLIATLFVASIYSSQSFAQSWTSGVAVSGGSDYYLYNVGAQRFIDYGMNWGTRATVDNAGDELSLVSSGNGYVIQSTIGYFGTNGYLDRPQGEGVAWEFNPVTLAGYSNVYTISYDGRYLVYQTNKAGDDNPAVNYTDLSNSNNDYWLLIPKSQRIEAGDYTFVFHNTCFNCPWQNSTWNENWGNKSGGEPYYRCAEEFNRTFDVHQVASGVPNGKYQLTCQGYYRAGGYGDNDATTQNAILYLNNDEAHLMNIVSGGADSQNGPYEVQCAGKWVPNGMNTASQVFFDGAYTGNSVTSVVTDGNVTIGVKKTTGIVNDWTIFTNFKLQYLGQTLNTGAAIALPTSGDLTPGQWYYFTLNEASDCLITTNTLSDLVYVTDGNLLPSEVTTPSSFASTIVNLVAGTYYIKSNSAQPLTILPAEVQAAPTGQMNADVKSALNAAYDAWNTTKNAENYNAVMEAIDAANASIALYEQIDARLSLLTAADQRGGLTEAQVKGLPFYTKYSDGTVNGTPDATTGTYTSLDQVISEYQSSIAAYYAANAPADGADLTAFIVNQGFEFGDLTGWTLPQGASGGDGSYATTKTTHGPESASEASYYYTSWWTGKPVQQVLGNLPNGTYRLSAKFATNDTGDEHTVYLYANDRNIATTHEANTYETWKDAESLEFVVTDGTATIGAVGGKQDNSFDVNNPWIFFNADNFRLTYVSSGIDVDVVLPTGQMNVDVKAAMNAANEAYLASKTLDNYNALLAAVESANASIALYQQINDRLAKLTSHSQLGSISEEDAKAMDFYTKYSDGSLEGTGTYTSLDEVITEYRANVAAYYATNAPDDGYDLSAFIVNNTLDFGNAAGWSGGGVNHGNIEWFNGNYNVFQTLVGLPAGTYHLQAQGYYRPGENGNASTDQNAMLYAGSFTAPVVLIASDGKSAADADNGFTTANTNSGSEVFVPNSQADAEKAFGTGAYYNEVEFISTGADINVGFKKDVLIQNDWTCFDNFKLIYMGSDATIAPELVNAPMNADIRQAQQDAFNTWNANKSMDNYNALIEAIEAAQASADKYVIINQRIPKLQDQADDIDAAVLRTKYDNGEYVEADDVFDAYRAVIAEYYAANPPAADADMSRFLINPDFEYGNVDGWYPNMSDDTGARDAHNGTYAFTNSHGDWVFNSWNPRNEMVWVVQETSGLPQGTYEVTAVFATDKDRTINFTAEDVQPKGSEQRISFQPVDEDITYTKANGIEKTITVFVSDGKLKVGANSWGFFKADNFRLKFISTDINDPDLTKPMNRFERQNYIDARADYDANPTQENLNELLERKLIVENSIRAYEAAKETFDHVLEMMSKTNVYTYDAYFTIDDMVRKYGPKLSEKQCGYYGYETLEDDVAFDMWRMFFGNGWYRDPNNFQIPAVPFIASAWDCGHDGYAYAYTGPGEEGTDHGSDYYANTWSMEGKDDGTFMYLPYLEYWREGDNLLDGKTMTATVEGTPGAEYTVKMLVRVRTYPEYTEPYPDPNNPDIDPMTIAGYPKGMTIQIGDGEPVTPRWTKINNADSPYRGTNGDKLWICDLWNYAEEDLPKGRVDQDGKLRIKFILDENINNGGTSNVAWLSFKYVYVNYDGEDLDQALADLRTEVTYANEHFHNNLGFDPGEYAPYTNIDELIALKRAQQADDASTNYFLVRSTCDKLREYNRGGENGEGTWTKNPYEMNGFYWTDYWNNNEPDKYTADDVQHVEWYGEEDDCITPSGWNLIGRADGFNTGIVKLGVNSDGEGLMSAESETALRAKYETDYGQETGYTLPLKAGVKYIMTFTYAYEGDNLSGCPFETRISLSAPTTGVDNVLTEPLTVTEIQPLLPSGGENQANWYMYRATFVPEFTADYVITFDKDNVDSEPVLYGDLTLVRYYEGDADPETSDENVYVINGESRTYGETLEEPKFVGKNVRITRSFNPGAYNSLVLPFKLAECELKEALGENWNGKVYYYTGATPTDTEGGDFYTLNFEERETGIFANVPVLFFNDADAPVNNWVKKIFNKMVTKRVENELTIDTDVFDFIGTYETIKLPNGAWYINAANQFMKAMGKSSLSPTRGYFLPRDANGEQILQAKLVGFSIDNVPTGIIAIEDDGTFNVTSGNIYTIDGRLVRQNATSLEGLAPGTYIVDGKKYIIK